MKIIQKVLLLIALFAGSSSMNTLFAQDSVPTDTTKTYIVIKNDNSRYIGKITYQDAREVHILTEELGELIIPKHEIREIREASESESNNDTKNQEIFSTRYFLSTNGLSLKENETYIIWSIYGPDIQFGLKNNFSVGVVTSWFGSPIIGSLKYSKSLGDKTSLGVGTLLGTGSWASPEYGIALPYTTFSYGDAANNLTFSAGYGTTWGGGYSGGRALFSVAGMTEITEKFSFVFDSFIVSGTGNDDSGALLIPGLRLQSSPDKAFQIGFAGIAAEGELIPFPLPMLQWFRRF
ncbi:hypothetical protein [Gracilimonas sp.]|uniref:hypothetical protein n=1 Tax=Gracilimonas sp. TaxID=1974203 RepID=UPI00287270D4|nr:hypothetical protein [Gracilimonas sp.]